LRQGGPDGREHFRARILKDATMLVALAANLTITGFEAKQTMPIRDFLTDTGNRLRSQEMLTEIQIPKSPEHSKQTYLKWNLRKPIDFAIVSVASVISFEHDVCADARIVLGSVPSAPVRAHAAEAMITGHNIDETLAKKAAEAAVKSAKPLAMNACKIDIAKTLLVRTVLSAANMRNSGIEKAMD
jgi:xanthine dehydrogenase YagS FAD-binding subunit